MGGENGRKGGRKVKKAVCKRCGSGRHQKALRSVLQNNNQLGQSGSSILRNQEGYHCKVWKGRV